MKILIVKDGEYENITLKEQTESDFIRDERNNMTYIDLKREDYK